MPVIDHQPTAHETVEFAVATSIANGAVTAIRVTLRSVGTLADPLQFVLDNELQQEILSKGGLDEELAVEFDNGTLESTDTQGSYYIYELSYPVASGTC